MALNYVIVSRLRRIYADARIVAAFTLEIPRVGFFREVRLWQHKTGQSFFCKGESKPTARENRYLSFFEFEGLFGMLLTQCVRQELIAQLIERHGELPLEDECLSFDEDRDEAQHNPKPSFEESIVIEPVRPMPLHGSMLVFNAVLGAGIKLKGLRLAGTRNDLRLLIPTSAGLSDRPYELDQVLRLEIIRRAAQMPPPQLPGTSYDVAI